MDDTQYTHMKNSTLCNCKLLNVPGLRLLGRGEDGDSAAGRFRDDCCPGMASSASSIIKFCKENVANVPCKQCRQTAILQLMYSITRYTTKNGLHTPICTAGVSLTVETTILRQQKNFPYVVFFTDYRIPLLFPKSLAVISNIT